MHSAFWARQSPAALQLDETATSKTKAGALQEQKLALPKVTTKFPS